MSDFKMPALGADMEAGTLVEWLVRPGDRVKSGDVVAVVETQKGAIEVEIFQQGVVSNILVPVGERVPVGTVLAQIDGARGAAPPPSIEPAIAALKPAPLRPIVAAPSSRLKITPAARRRATALSLDPTMIVKGTGVEGSIRLADVETYASGAKLAQRPAKKGLDLSQMRQAIAAAMSHSKREIPHYYLTEMVDLHAASTWIEQYNAEKSPVERILPAVLFLKAAALALREQPQLNGAYENGAFTPASDVHVGWAIALRGGGLIAPAIRDTDRKSLAELMAAMRDLVERARRGNLRSSELTSPTITVTSVGDRGAESVTGIIYPPQVAIVGFGRAVARPWVVDGRIESCPLVTVSLAADHRVTDGHVGGLYLAAVARLLQEPEKL
ncbi:dihydrolipoamide acetyltransferase family protein [Methylocystis rosea]|uniref:Dihydrolipoamide acetyltransferase component of pyruvate dehydrogenase complex n=1 Tax=Methylocystis rosea TaxID=173366 RepID=A0A3G8MCJ1_9HYPH|nr:dihydrolipoamide acetyltransferase family protein [Methylocystis rosea]AZG78910.1 2-oxo acid dehydrogenase subunit E2 [Methylocystis rosea]